MGYEYCRECYGEERDKCRNIHDYGYKHEPIFYGDSNDISAYSLKLTEHAKMMNTQRNFLILQMKVMSIST
ncbi:MAG: hypothetical protein NC452_07005 [Eubacterium sp.]|nr:hypothetical protein [Eubacterium sp.]